MHDRGLNTNSLGLPFLPPRKIAFPAACGLRVTPSWGALAGRSFCSGIGPWGPAPREGSHTPRERPANLHTAVPSCALQERALEPRPVCTVLSSCGQNTLGAHLEPEPGVQTGFFRQGSPNAGRSSNCLQRPPMAVCFLLPELALLSASVFRKLGAGPPFFAGVPLEVPGALGRVTPAWHPAPSDTLPQPLSPWAALC